MIILKLQDRYDQKTGVKIGSFPVKDHIICDFTGNMGQYHENLGPIYDIDYGSLDPCIGCMDIEYEVSKKWNFETYGLIGGYHLDEENFGLMDMVNGYTQELGEEPRFISHLFRWARAKTVDRLLTEGKYTLEELGLEYYNDEDYE